MTAILLAPAPEWREALLREGPCGARVPTVVRVIPGSPKLAGSTEPAWSTDLKFHRLAWLPEDTQSALVLAWDGAPVAEGIARAVDVLASVDDLDTSMGALWQHGPDFGKGADWSRLIVGADQGPAAWSHPKPPMTGLLRRPWSLATVCASHGLGTVVTLGAPDV